MMSHDFMNDSRFIGIKPLIKRAHLSSPTIHREAEMRYIEECYMSGWLTTVGNNINLLEDTVSAYMNVGGIKKRAVPLIN